MTNETSAGVGDAASREDGDPARSTDARRTVLTALVDVATERVPHLFNGLCPDRVEGPDVRDPDCAACQAILVAELAAADEGEPVGADRDVAVGRVEQVLRHGQRFGNRSVVVAVNDLAVLVDLARRGGER